MSTQQLPPNRAQSWFPGVYVSIRHIQGVEFASESRRTGVRVFRTTLHGTASELRNFAAQLLAAADRLEAPRAA